MNKADSAHTQLLRLADALVEDIMSLSDEELLAEVREDGEDPEQIATEMRALIAQAVARANEQRQIGDCDEPFVREDHDPENYGFGRAPQQDPIFRFRRPRHGWPWPRE